MTSERLTIHEKVDLWLEFPKRVDPDLHDRISNISKGAREFAHLIVDNTPSCADRNAALRKVREAVSAAVASVVCGGK